MRRAWLAALLLACPLGGLARAAAAQETAADSLRKRFPAEERWLLSAILSDPRQKAAFETEAGQALRSGDAAQADFGMRWRKKALAFAQEYQRHLLTTDILPDATSVERMVSDYEFTVMTHWLAHQTPERQAQVMKQISDGNAALGWFRKTVEARVRNNRKKAAEELARYLDSKPAGEVLAYVPASQARPGQVARLPGPGTAPATGAKPGNPAGTNAGPAKPPSDPGRGPDKPQAPAKPGEPAEPGQAPAGKNPDDTAAMDQLRGAAGNGRAAAGAGNSPEDMSGRAGTDFTGGAANGSATPVPVGQDGPAAPPPDAAGPAAGLGPGAGSNGGFTVNPVPDPVVRREEPRKSNILAVVGKMLMPNLIGALVGAIVGFLLGGLPGLLVGALISGAVGYGVGKLLSD